MSTVPLCTSSLTTPPPPLSSLSLPLPSLCLYMYTVPSLLQAEPPLPLNCRKVRWSPLITAAAPPPLCIPSSSLSSTSSPHREHLPAVSVSLIHSKWSSPPVLFHGESFAVGCRSSQLHGCFPPHCVRVPPLVTIVYSIYYYYILCTIDRA